MLHIYNLTNTRLIIDGGKYIIPPHESIPLYAGDTTSSVGVQTALMRKWARVADSAEQGVTQAEQLNMTPPSLQNWDIIDSDGKKIDVYTDPNMDIDQDPHITGASAEPVSLTRTRTKKVKEPGSDQTS